MKIYVTLAVEVPGTDSEAVATAILDNANFTVNGEDNSGQTRNFETSVAEYRSQL